MLGIVSMAGNALKAFGNTHPAVKWGVIVLAFLLAAEFVAKEGRDVYVSIVTTPYVLEKAKGDAEQAKAQGDFECRMKGGCVGIEPDDVPTDIFKTPESDALIKRLDEDMARIKKMDAQQPAHSKQGANQ
jgi:hypothetical protein